MWPIGNRTKKAHKLLSKGRVGEAIELYRQEGAWDALAVAYERQGDYASAADAAGRAGLVEQAAELSERAGEHKRAAEFWLQCSKKDRAAAALEQAKDFESAAGLYAELGMLSRAADARAALGEYDEAAELYGEAGQFAKAVSMYRRAGDLGGAARVLRAAGNTVAAAQLYQEAGSTAEAAALYAQAGMASEGAECYIGLGDYGQAGKLLEEAGHPFEAAEAYERDDQLLRSSAKLFRNVLRPELAWLSELDAALVCLSMSEDGSYVAVGCANREVQLLDDDGQLLWRYKPMWGGLPSCVALSRDGRLALGCDDRNLYFVARDKSLLWDFDLAAEPVKVSVTPSASRIACCTKDGRVVCLDSDGSVRWQRSFGKTVWDVALSEEGTLCGVARADGTCVLLGEDGKEMRHWSGPDWVHSVSLSADGAMLALGRGMCRVELVHVRRQEPVWAVDEPSWVHNVVLTPQHTVLTVADDAARLRNKEGAVICRYAHEHRLMSGQADATGMSVVLRCVKNQLVWVDFHDCVRRAAANYEKCGDLASAATAYQDMGSNERAAELFERAEDYSSAARSNELLAHYLKAAELYGKAGQHEKAGEIYEANDRIQEAAMCFRQAGRSGRAAELFEELGDFDQAAKLFQAAERYDEAARLYSIADDKAAAIGMLEEHLRSNAQDMAARLRLGVLLKESGRYDTALEQLQRAAADQEYRRPALLHSAECFMRMEHYDVAVDRFEAALEQESISTDNLGVFYGMAKARELGGHYDQASQMYADILGVDYRYRDVQERLRNVQALSGVFARRGPELHADRTVIADQAGFERLSAETKERYSVKKALGAGGMGAVYLAEDKRLRRTVALKVLSSHLAEDDKLRLRLVREAQAVAQLSHPNIVGVFDVGEEKGRSYISMEYVEGQTLRGILSDKGTLEPRECVDLLLQVTDALGYAHQKGIVHRDVKPENVMVTEDGTAKVMDFGLALVEGATRLTKPGAAAGTLQYMAPEQIRGEPRLSPAVDVYAAGRVAYELLTGSLVSEGAEFALQHALQRPEPLAEVRPDVPQPLADLIMKCLSREPEDRYPDATSLNAALREVSADL